MAQPVPPQQQQLLPHQHQHQHQQLPQHQQFQQQFQGKPMPPHVSSKGMWSTKLIFRIISIVCCLVIIGISASVVVSGPYYTAIIVLGPPAGIAFIWNVSEGICLCVRRGHRGIHPGAVVGVDLVLWLGYLVAVVLFAIMTGVADGYYGYYEYYGGLTNQRAIFAFGILEIIIHLTLFIIGCYETSVRNRNPATQVIYLQAGPNGTVMYPPNFPMTQAYQPVYAQAQLPVQQYQYAPINQPKMSELQTTIPPPVSPTYIQPVGR
ncbi:hypothetical protein G7Z17_g6301 [Cylindrodendrum hubeiense]|uniref:Transmembrane protein n=1 Tax=Cylindrodendrum hubeiense TaxID=595255 RepID=A0A9P5HFG9_9HYPO|nr:hypothetical protein G7Z17_g6301 [Cylindrodendrum hubeiense]